MIKYNCTIRNLDSIELEFFDCDEATLVKLITNIDGNKFSLERVTLSNKINRELADYVKKELNMETGNK